MKDLRVVFMGTPDFAVPILKHLLENTEVVLVVSQPDKKVGRKQIMTASPVKTLAQGHGLEVITPVKIREDYERILEVKPDIIVTCAYGQIIPKVLIDAPKYGCVNVHASLLPKYRGGAPMHRAIMEGEKETGITIMYMDEHMDSGDIIAQSAIPIAIDDTLDTLSAKLKQLGGPLLIASLEEILSGTATRTEQDSSLVTYGYVITKEDELVDFKLPTRAIYDKIRALNSTPGAYFLMDGRHMKVYSSRTGTGRGEPSTIINIYKDGFGVATADGEIVITEVKPEGKNRSMARDYLNGVDKNKLIGKRLNDRLD